MQIVDSYQVIITNALRECRDFYVKWFDFEVAFEASWFVLLSSSGEHSTSIAFMHPEHPSSPPSPGPFRGDGSFLTLQVEDAAAAYELVTGAGLLPDLPLTDEPWGQRRFGVIDPAGMWVDVVEQMDPTEGWGILSFQRRRAAARRQSFSAPIMARTPSISDGGQPDPCRRLTS